LDNSGVVITFEDFRGLYKKRKGSMGKFLLFLAKARQRAILLLQTMKLTNLQQIQENYIMKHFIYLFLIKV
jgi:hypothetical protein